MKKKKNVWFFHPTATPLNSSGMPRPYNFGIRLNEKGFGVRVFSSSHLHYSNKNLIQNDELFIEDHSSKVPFVYVNTPSYQGNGIDRIKNMFVFYRNVMKAAQTFIDAGEKPDVIISSSPHPLTLVAGIKMAQKLGIPSVCEVRDFWPEVLFLGGRLKETSILGRILLKGEHWIYKNASALVFLKKGDHTYISDKKWDTEQGGDINLEKCYYINNGVNLSEYHNLIENHPLSDPDLEDDRFKVVYTGAVRAVNNIGNVLDAAKLVQNHTDIHFIIYGDGNQLKELQERVEKEGISNVTMKGQSEKKHIPYILSKASVNLLNYSSTMYNWSRGNSSNKLFEYMASGKPIISTVKMGYSIIEHYQCGIELAENTPKELAKAVLEIKGLSNAERQQIGRNAVAAAANFDYDILTEKLETVIHDVTN